MTSFDIDEFLARPLTARVATNGPTVRPTWYLWEDHAFWILSGPWSRLPAHLRSSPRIALTVDVCELATGLVRQVVASGAAEVVAFDVPRGRRKLVRYLGPDEKRWDPRFRAYLDETERGTVWVRLTPESLRAKDLPTMSAPLRSHQLGEQLRPVGGRDVRHEARRGPVGRSSAHCAGPPDPDRQAPPSTAKFLVMWAGIWRQGRVSSSL